jgi:hypothetical protein
MSVQNIVGTGTPSSTVVEFLNSTTAIDGGGAFVGLKGTGNIGDTLGVWNHQAGPIVLQTGLSNRSSLVRMYVDPDGDVAIGGRIPSERFHVQGGNLLIDTVGSSGTAGQLQFRNPAGTFKTNLQAGAQAVDITYTLPTAAPTAGQVLSSDASGNMSWVTASGGGGGALSAITAATANNTINNGVYAQTWDWNSLSSNTGMTFRSSSVSAVGNAQTVVGISTSGANTVPSQTTYGMQVTNTHTGTSSTNVAALFSATGGTNNYGLLVSNGTVGIGTTTPAYTLHVNGSVAGTSAYNNLSDGRLKKNVKTIDNALDKVMALRGVTYDWDTLVNPAMRLDAKNHLGFIAQELETVVPQAVSTSSDSMKTKAVAYSELIPLLTEAIKEQQQTIQKQQGMIEKLEGSYREYQTLQTRYTELQGSINAMREQMNQLQKLLLQVQQAQQPK